MRELRYILEGDPNNAIVTYDGPLDVDAAFEKFRRDRMHGSRPLKVFWIIDPKSEQGVVEKWCGHVTPADVRGEGITKRFFWADGAHG